MTESKTRAITGALKNYYNGFGLVLQTAALVVTASAVSANDLLLVKASNFLGSEYPFEAREMDATETLDYFSRMTGLPVDANVEGKVVTLNNMDGSVTDFLDTFADQTTCVWWYDGMRVRFEPLASMRSSIVGSRGLNIETLENAMSFVGLSNDKFETRVSDDGMLFNVVGPEGYITDVEELMGQIIHARKNRRAGLPIVYKGQVAANQGENAAPPTPAAQIVHNDS
jgi:hypothetical protein